MHSLLLLFILIGACFASTQFKYYSNSKCEGEVWRTDDLDSCSMYGKIITTPTGIKYYRNMEHIFNCISYEGGFVEYAYGNCYLDKYYNSFFSISNNPQKDIVGSCYSSMALTSDFKTGFSITQIKNGSCYQMDNEKGKEKDFTSMICTQSHTTILRCVDSACANCTESDQILNTENEYDYDSSYFYQHKYIEFETQKSHSPSSISLIPKQLITLALLFCCWLFF
ncbi:hypothetical protein CYY_006035 [Polysphondylium violaceum]|uniref:Transmembrane protein n=1 Tax=Polysphondylium violaceum TaxID=133409 RepID=A0A8J4Q197_9MYCE|nr:hypothetical protein CYY_006035 [Polysphondylium violaceum]